VDTREAARRWAETWERGWRALDPEPVAALYADDCRLFLSHPFRPHAPPRAYVARALGDTEWAEPWFGEPMVAGDRAAVEWWAFAREGGTDVTIAGVSLLRFGAEGLVVEQRDVFALTEGRVERQA
jgi:SnoaL-like domain